MEDHRNPSFRPIWSIRLDPESKQTKRTKPQNCYNQQPHSWKMVRQHFKHRFELGTMNIDGDCNLASKINAANKNKQKTRIRVSLPPLFPFLSFTFTILRMEHRQDITTEPHPLARLEIFNSISFHRIHRHLQPWV